MPILTFFFIPVIRARMPLNHFLSGHNTSRINFYQCCNVTSAPKLESGLKITEHVVWRNAKQHEVIGWFCSLGFVVSPHPPGLILGLVADRLMQDRANILKLFVTDDDLSLLKLVSDWSVWVYEHFRAEREGGMLWRVCILAASVIFCHVFLAGKGLTAASASPKTSSALLEGHQ